MGGDNEWLFPMGPRKLLNWFSPQAEIDAGINPETARSADHHLATEVPGYWGSRRCLCVCGVGVGAVRVCVFWAAMERGKNSTKKFKK